MGIKELALAAVVAIAPFAVSAATFTGNISPGDTVDLVDIAYTSTGTFDSGDAAGVAVYTFQNMTAFDKDVFLSISVNQNPLTTFVGGVSGTFGSTPFSQPALSPGSALFIENVLAGNSITLTVNYGAAFSSIGGTPTFNFTTGELSILPPPPSEVPLPAGGLLLGTALVAFGVARRRKRAA